MSRFIRVVAYSWLLLMFGMMLSSALQKSPTMDDDNHLVRGLAFLQTGDSRLSFYHPPLVNSLAAFPVALNPAAQIPVESDAWRRGDWETMSDLVVLARGAAADSMINISRIPIMLLALALGALIFRWARELNGPGAALLSLTLYTFDPNILAHSRLNTTDLGVTAFVFLAGYGVWRWQARPAGLQSSLLVGFLIGLELGSKYLALIFVLFFGLLMLVKRETRPGTWRRAVRTVGWLTLMAGVSILTLWAIYGFGRDGPWPGSTVRWPLGL